MIIVRLNDMRHSKSEILVPAARAETLAELRAFLESQEVEPYRDGQWGKSFKRGGPLEWFNNYPYEFVDVDAEFKHYKEALMKLPAP